MTKSSKIIIITIVALILVTIPFVVMFSFNIYAKSKVENITSKMKGRCNITYADVSYNIITRDLLIKNVKVSCDGEDTASFGLLKFSHILFGDNLPDSFIVKFSNGSVNMLSSLFKTYGKPASELGYSNIEIDGKMSYTFAKKTQRVKINSLIIDAKNIGKLTSELIIDGISSVDFVSVFYDIIYSSRLSFAGSFQDSGLVLSLMNMYASKIKIDPAKAKEHIHNGIQRLIVNSEDNDVREKYTELQKFLDNSSSIHVNIAPASALSIKDIIKYLNNDNLKEVFKSLDNLPISISAK